ncbi:MAG: protein kinase domain-containing protein [Pyrinomonadaceae bacterium]
MKCPECTSEIAEESPSCPSCGAGLEEVDAKTRILPEDSKPDSGRRISSPSGPTRRTPAPSRQTGIHSTTDSLDRARFVAGTILNDRYRVVGLLGRGGMGEVYRAEDLKLEQPVALKFLPESLSFDGAALARFHREVRVARQISHRNVCRVYDIGEFDGLHFLSMEYIRGEELSSVLKRFGRLPVDKAVEIARQVCAGLAAAHDAGVLHRDLKPSNVMIDENGNVRITDFGLAGLVEEFGEGAALEGTPEYMSPEQLKGNELTAGSDIYSLGLVIYELFTGHKAFSASTLNDLLRLRKSESLPESPSHYVKDLDPVVERVIERCIATDPRERPASALQVAAALPGGDPLAAALAAGETPSPEMVAAASKQGSLRPAVAVALLSGALVLFALCFALSGSVYLHRYVPLEKTTQALQDRAWEISSRLGYSAATDRASGFAPNAEYISYVQREDRSPARWEPLKTGHPSGIVFWYRQSPRYLEPFNRDEVTPVDPPRTISGMVALTLDMRGRLLGFEAVPPQVVDAQASAPAPFEWSRLFNEAGLDPSTFKPVAPVWVSPHPFDAQAAWEGTYPGQPDTKLRLEAASFRGLPVYFQLVNPWKQPMRQEETPLPAPERILQAFIIVLFLVVLVGAALLARHNLRLGRGDRKGALRLAGFVFLLTNVSWLFTAHHVPSFNGEFSSFIESLSFSLLVGCLLWLVYVAVEPFVRRRWPGRIISWNRLLAGDWRDPLVGRDLLLGAFFGSALTLLSCMQIFVPHWLGMPATPPAQVVMRGLLGFQFVPNLLIAQILNSLTFPAVFMFLVLLLTIVTRHERVAIVLFGLIYAALYLGGSNIIIDAPLGLIISATTIFILLRFGMLTLVFTEFFILFFSFYPITSDFSAWYAGSSAFAAALGTALILYGFKSSLAGQQIFKGSFVGD